MKTSLSKSRTVPNRHNGKKSRGPECLCDESCGLYHEEYFKDMLSLERKRTERSRKPFLLMLVDIEKIPADNGWDTTIRKITDALFASTRETDLKGWFTDHAVMGIIFTEINGVDRGSIKRKVTDHLYGALGRELAGMIAVSLCIFPEEEGTPGSGCSPDLNFYPELTKKETSRKGSIALKRLMDVFGSIVAFILFAPFFITISVLIKLTSKGPVFFMHERVGQYGKTFAFLKFRSMYANNDTRIHQEYIKKYICEQKEYSAEGGNGKEACVYKIKDDPRVTPIGKFLRKTSLDELPQFINVFRGEMSIVGPRPPIPYELENYDIWHRRRVLEVKPGITGLWQVSGRSKTNFNDMVRLDLKYTREWSLWMDLKIIALTPWVVLTGKGAY